jgi:hypothetical protein
MRAAVVMLAVIAAWSLTIAPAKAQRGSRADRQAGAQAGGSVEASCRAQVAKKYPNLVSTRQIERRIIDCVRFGGVAR